MRKRFVFSKQARATGPRSQRGKALYQMVQDKASALLDFVRQLRLCGYTWQKMRKVIRQNLLDKW